MFAFYHEIEIRLYFISILHMQWLREGYRCPSLNLLSWNCDTRTPIYHIYLAYAIAACSLSFQLDICYGIMETVRTIRTLLWFVRLYFIPKPYVRKIRGWSRLKSYAQCILVIELMGRRRLMMETVRTIQPRVRFILYLLHIFFLIAQKNKGRRCTRVVYLYIKYYNPYVIKLP
jgi:hypothetical protein